MKSAIIFSMILTCLTAGIAGAGNLPKDFRVTLHDGGGMARKGATYFLSRDSSYAEMYDNAADNKYYFKASFDDLNHLYSVFIENNFPAIETFEEMVYDRGGTTIQVTYGGDSYSKSDAGMTFIAEKWRDEFNAVENEIRSIVAKELAKLEQDVTINLDESIIGADKIVNFNIGDFAYMSARDGYQKTVTVNLLPGEHYMYFTMLNKDLSTEPGSKIFAQGDGILTIDKNTAAVFVYREGEVVFWK